MGQKHAVCDADGTITAFHDSVDSPPLEGVTVTDISDEDWMMLLEGQSNGKVMAIDPYGQPVLKDPPPPTSEQLAATARAERNAKLIETDWVLQRHQEETLMNMSPTLTPEEGTALAVYRQALRDIPQQPGFPEVIDWPVPPALS
jgi:Phage tail assembly chaperone protein